MEDIVLLETKQAKKKCEVFRLQFANGEFDMVVFDPDEELAREIMQAFTWEYSFAGAECLPVKSSATSLIEKANVTPLQVFENSETEIELAIEKEGAEQTNTEAGLAYHAFLENFDFDLLFDNGKRVDKKGLKRIIEGVLERNIDKEAYALLSKEKLLEILSNPVFYTLQGRTLYKERQFLVSLPVKNTYALKEEYASLLQKTDGEEMLFQGAIDLLAEGEEDVLIIDYKYSKGSAEYLREHYKPQLDLYKAAVAKIIKLPLSKVKCKIVNIYHGFEVDM